MKLKLAWLSFGLACLVAGTAPVTAADIDNGDAGGMKDSIYDGVPVPAPAPSPLYDADWYVRADIGYSFSSDNDVTVRGGGFTAFDDDDTDGPAAFSIGFGRYLGRNLRAEFTLDIRNDFKLGSSNQSHLGYVSESIPTTVAVPYGGTTDTHTYDVNRKDEARIGNYTGLLNLYYDFANKSRFTPYLGIGGGVVVHTFKRKHSESATCISSTNDVNGDYLDGFGDPICSSNTPAAPYYPNTSNNPSSNVETGYGLAANLMAGVSFEVHDNILLDINYRYMWMGGDVKIIAPTLDRSSTIQIGDTSNHDIRAGIRWNIN